MASYKRIDGEQNPVQTTMTKTISLEWTLRGPGHTSSIFRAHPRDLYP